jgi:hypothetical protein
MGLCSVLLKLMAQESIRLKRLEFILNLSIPNLLYIRVLLSIVTPVDDFDVVVVNSGLILFA